MRVLAVGFSRVLHDVQEALSKIFTVKKADDVTVAMECLCQQSFDLVLLSPTLTSSEQSHLAHRIKQVWHLPVVALYTFAPNADLRADLSVCTFDNAQEIVGRIRDFISHVPMRRAA